MISLTPWLFTCIVITVTKLMCSKIAVQAKSPFQLDFFVDATNHNTRKCQDRGSG